MSRSEFRYNKKRKHYSYLFKDLGTKRKIIVFSSKPYRKVHNKMKKNIRLYRHPNPSSDKQAYLIPYVYVDDISVFDVKILKWKFHPNDKRQIKRIKKRY